MPFHALTRALTRKLARTPYAKWRRHHTSICRCSTVGGFLAFGRTVRVFGEAQTATSSSWASAPHPVLATALIRAVAVEPA
eukprot:496108-Alexandrium_andersonii.AAC.1